MGVYNCPIFVEKHNVMPNKENRLKLVLYSRFIHDVIY